MRRRNQNTMQAIQRYIASFTVENGHSPSTTDIAQQFEMSRSTAYYHIKDMEKNGFLDYSGGVIRLLSQSIDTASAPAALLGSIPCGEPDNEEESIELMTSLPVAVFGRGPFYMLHASGDSMEDEDIFDGDLLVIRKQDHAMTGQIVVAMDDKNQNTLKRYAGIDAENGYAILEYCNHAVYGDKKIYVPTLVCQGVLSHIIKEK